MDNKKCTTGESRRSALKKIAAGVGVLAGCAVLPEQWTRPIIGHIVLPAHAATSGETPPPPTILPSLLQCTLNIQEGDQGTAAVNWGVSGFVDPPLAGVPIHVVATATGGGADVFTFDFETVAGGSYGVGTQFANGPGYTSISATITSSLATGSTTCSDAVPAPPVIG